MNKNELQKPKTYIVIISFHVNTLIDVLKKIEITIQTISRNIEIHQYNLFL